MAISKLNSYSLPANKVQWTVEPQRAVLLIHDMQRSLWHTPKAEQEMINGFSDQYKLGIPLRKIAKPQEVVNNILFLASDLASHVVLQNIVVDSGATLGA